MARKKKGPGLDDFFDAQKRGLDPIHGKYNFAQANPTKKRALSSGSDPRKISTKTQKLLSIQRKKNSETHRIDLRPKLELPTSYYDDLVHIHDGQITPFVAHGYKDHKPEGLYSIDQEIDEKGYFFAITKMKQRCFIRFPFFVHDVDIAESLYDKTFIVTLPIAYLTFQIDFPEEESQSIQAAIVHHPGIYLAQAQTTEASVAWDFAASFLKLAQQTEAYIPLDPFTIHTNGIIATRLKVDLTFVEITNDWYHKTSQIIGRKGFLPEEVLAGELTPTSSIGALGCVMAYIRTGKPLTDTNYRAAAEALGQLSTRERELIVDMLRPDRDIKYLLEKITSYVETELHRKS